MLLVDDDRVLLGSLSRTAARTWNAHVAAAADLVGARQSLRDRQPDLAVIDLVLPDGSGIDLVAELRERSRDTWVVLVSGLNSVDSTVRAMRAGANDVLCKPFTLNEIARRLWHGPQRSAPPLQVPTINRVAWEHVQRVYQETGHNKSQAARHLGIDRNTLKRWLAMPPPSA